MTTMRRLSACNLIALMIAAAPVRADPVADFYRGKTLSIVVGYGPGGGFDLAARAGQGRDAGELRGGSGARHRVDDQAGDRLAQRLRQRRPAGGDPHVAPAVEVLLAHVELQVRRKRRAARTEHLVEQGLPLAEPHSDRHNE